jgi:hypothetical protein
VYPFEAIVIGSAGATKERVAVGMADHASIGLVVSFIEPSIKSLPGVGQ